MKKVIILFSFLLIFLSSNPIYASKVDVGSVPQINESFIVYNAMHGESISSILKKYQISLNDFFKANKQVEKRGTIISGEKIYIPRHAVGSSSDSAINKEIKKYVKNFKKNNSKKPSMLVVSSSDEVSGNKLTEVALPDDESQTVLRKLDPSTKKYDYHTVQPKETLYGISVKYKVTVDAIIDANANLETDGLQAGVDIRIPKKSNLVAVEQTDFDLFDNIEKSEIIDIAIIMPIMGEKDPRNDGFSDLYRGLLFAVDSLKKIGISTKIDFYGVGREVEFTRQLIESNKLSSKSLIIGPVFPEQFQLVANYAKLRNIPIINPLLSVEDSSSNIIEIIPTKETYWDKAEGFFADKKVIYYTSNNDDYQFLEDFAKICPLVLDTMVYDKFADPKTMAEILDKDKENVFIVSAKDNLNNELLLSKLVALKAIAYNRKISVFASTNISNTPKERRGDFFKVNLRYLTTSFQDRTNPASFKFETDYVRMFNLAPSAFSYRGYEIGMILLKELHDEKNNFMESLNDAFRQVIQVPYLFYRENNTTKLINQEWLLVNYTTDHSIIIE